MAVEPQDGTTADPSTAPLVDAEEQARMISVVSAASDAATALAALDGTEGDHPLADEWRRRVDVFAAELDAGGRALLVSVAERLGDGPVLDAAQASGRRDELAAKLARSGGIAGYARQILGDGERTSSDDAGGSVLYVSPGLMCAAGVGLIVGGALAAYGGRELLAGFGLAAGIAIALTYC